MDRALATLLFLLMVVPVSLSVLADDALAEHLSLESLRQEYSDPDGQIAEIGGVEVYYKDQGEGPAILMIHGSRSTLRISEQTRREYYDFNRRVPEANSTALIGIVEDHQKARKAMAGVRAPTLLIWGGRDALLIPASAGVLGSYLENTQVSTVFMPDVGHYPPLESPIRFAKIVAAYIEGATPNATP